MSFDRRPNPDPDRIAQGALLAMLLELSSSPKPGNVDRCHDFDEMGFQDFLVSAVSAYPVFRKAAEGSSGAGRLILDAVQALRSWGISRNTHFGSLTLMIPLAVAAGRAGPLEDELRSVLEGTTVEDSIHFYRAFLISGARVTDVGDLSLKDPASSDRLRREGQTLLDLMILSQDHDLVAREWATSYRRSFALSTSLREKTPLLGTNRAVVLTFLEALAEEPDTLIMAKFGRERAEEVSRKAGRAAEDETLGLAADLDRELLASDTNPGSTADLIAAALFIALLKGMRFQ